MSACTRDFEGKYGDLDEYPLEYDDGGRLDAAWRHEAEEAVMGRKATRLVSIAARLPQRRNREWHFRNAEAGPHGQRAHAAGMGRRTATISAWMKKAAL